ncbi:MAG: IclR family transcriptional regulator [Kineosporiaceae bacterium]|nr:IclR family transcriptional regulator [Kineosporiaceae bacterium]
MCPTERNDAASDASSPTSLLERASLVLGCFDAEHAEIGISDIARRSGLAKSTTHRLAAELIRLGLLEQGEGGGVRLGLRLFELGQLVPRRHALHEAARPFMEDLREATGNNVHLAVLDGIEVVYVEILWARDVQPLPSRVGGRLPAHATGVGKAMLAFSSPEVVRARIEAGLARRTAYTIIMPGALTRELAAIRASGISYDRQESAMGVVCAACPVFGVDGAVVAALSVTGRAERLDIERMAPAVRTAALALSRSLGAPTPT